MLPPFIIEQIRRREEEERRKNEHQPALELPVPRPARPMERKPSDDEKDRGVVIIDLCGD